MMYTLGGSKKVYNALIGEAHMVNGAQFYRQTGEIAFEGATLIGYERLVGEPSRGGMGTLEEIPVGQSYLDAISLVAGLRGGHLATSWAAGNLKLEPTILPALLETDPRPSPVKEALPSVPTSNVFVPSKIIPNAGVKIYLDTAKQISQLNLQEQPKQKNRQIFSSEIKLEQSELVLGGSQNKGVYRVILSGYDRPFVIKLNESYKAKKEARFYEWMDENQIGPAYYGVVEVVVEGQKFSGILMEDCGGHAFKIAPPFSSTSKSYIAERWNQNSWQDWSRIKFSFENSTIQPRDFEIFIKPDGHLVMIDASMFMDLNGINIASENRLSGLYSFERSILAIVGF